MFKTNLVLVNSPGSVNVQTWKVSRTESRNTVLANEQEWKGIGINVVVLDVGGRGFQRSTEGKRVFVRLLSSNMKKSLTGEMPSYIVLFRGIYRLKLKTFIL